MPATVTVDDITGLISTKLGESDLLVFAGNAETYVDERLGSEGLSDARLSLIAKYLAAHLIAMTIEPQHRARQEAKGSVYSYAKGDKLEIALNNTTWGQMAAFFDPTNKLKDDSIADALSKLFDIYGPNLE